MVLDTGLPNLGIPDVLGLSPSCAGQDSWELQEVLSTSDPQQITAEEMCPLIGKENTLPIPGHKRHLLTSLSKEDKSLGKYTKFRVFLEKLLATLNT